MYQDNFLNKYIFGPKRHKERCFIYFFVVFFFPFFILQGERGQEVVILPAMFPKPKIKILTKIYIFAQLEL